MAAIVDTQKMSGNVSQQVKNLTIGDRVSIIKIDSKTMEHKFGDKAWNPIFGQYSGLVGIIHKLKNNNGSFGVIFNHKNSSPRYDNSDVVITHQWSFPNQLIKHCTIRPFICGDLAVVTKDVGQLRRYNRHRWTQNMSKLCGNVVTVCDISKGLIQVKLRSGNSTETFILSSCSLIPVYRECVIGTAPFLPFSFADTWKPSIPVASQQDSVAFINAVNEHNWTDVIRLALFPSLVNLKIPPDNKTALLHAMEANNSAIVKRLLLVGARITFGGISYAHVAIDKDSSEMLDTLLPYIPDVNVCNMTGETLLHVALRTPSKPCVLSLLKRSDINLGAKTAAQTGHGNCSIAIYAVSSDDRTLLELVIKHPKFDIRSLKEPCGQGLLPLNYAMNFNNIPGIESLLTTDPSLLFVTMKNDGVTAFHLAVQNFSLTIVDLFLSIDKVSDIINFKTKRNQTPMHFVALREDKVEAKRIADWLLRCGARLNDRDISGNTVLHLAARSLGEELKKSKLDSQQIQQLLRQTHADYDNMVGTFGQLLPSLPLIYYLLMVKGDPDLENNTGKTLRNLIPKEFNCVWNTFVAEPAPVSVIQRDSSSSDCTSCLNCHNEPEVMFQPCGHQVYCKRCITQFRSNKCPTCRKKFTSITELDGVKLIDIESLAASQIQEDLLQSEEYQFLMQRNQDLEEAVKCPVCFDVRFNEMVAFQPCGHTVCMYCSKGIIAKCHMCAGPIAARTRVYQ